VIASVRRSWERSNLYDFNLLVSCPWAATHKAKREIAYLLQRLGDQQPKIKPTAACGILGVKTRLDPREVVQALQKLQSQNPVFFQHTLKWIPIDSWVNSDIESMKAGVEFVKDRIKHGERWRMTVEKRRYTLYHKIDIIRELAQLVDEKVDLTKPDKILRIDIIGKYAGISVLLPHEVFSATRLLL